MSSRATNAHDDFARLSLAVGAAHKAAWIPYRLPPDDAVKLQLIGVPALALVAPDVAARRAKDDETAALPEAAWKPIINRFRLAAAKERLAEAMTQTEGICGRFPESRLRSVDLAIIRQRLYGSPDKWRGHFSATSASVAWLREFRILCRFEGWTVKSLRGRVDSLRAINVSSAIRSDEMIVDRLLGIEKRLTKWVTNLPADFDVVQRSLAIEAEFLRSSPGSQFTADEQRPIRDQEAGDSHVPGKEQTAAINRGFAPDEPSTTDSTGNTVSSEEPDKEIGKVVYEMRLENPQPAMERVRKRIASMNLGNMSVRTLDRKMRDWCKDNNKTVPRNATNRGRKPRQRRTS